MNCATTIKRNNLNKLNIDTKRHHKQNMKHRGETLSQRHKLQTPKLTENFQPMSLNQDWHL